MVPAWMLGCVPLGDRQSVKFPVTVGSPSGLLRLIGGLKVNWNDSAHTRLASGGSAASAGIGVRTTPAASPNDASTVTARRRIDFRVFMIRHLRKKSPCQ